MQMKKKRRIKKEPYLKLRNPQILTISYLISILFEGIKSNILWIVLEQFCKKNKVFKTIACFEETLNLAHDIAS